LFTILDGILLTQASEPSPQMSKVLLIQHIDTYAGEWNAAANSTLELKIFW
jgi:hypothetical protein